MEEIMNIMGFVIEDNFLIEEEPAEQIIYNLNGEIYEA